MREGKIEEIPLVSVIITTYNRPELLKQAIYSVESQTYNRIELVIIDDNSEMSPQSITDDCEIESIENVVFYRHEENKGVSAARNTGIKNSSGDLICFLDDDDRYKRDKIEKQIEKYKNTDKNNIIIYTGFRSVNSDQETISVQISSRSGDLTQDLLTDFSVWLPTIMAPRYIIEKAGLFEEEMLMFEDEEWVVRLSLYADFIPVPEPLLISLRDDEHSQKSDHVEDKLDNGYEQLIEKYRSIGSDYGMLFERKVVAYCRFWMGYSSLTQRRIILARKYFCAAIVSWPFTFKFYLYLLLSYMGYNWYARARKIKRFIK